MAIIRIKNMANIDVGDENEYENKLASHCQLGNGFVWLVFYDDSLPPNLQGRCVPKDLLYLCPEPYNSSIINSNDWQEHRKWDCYIAISEEWCEKKDKYPAYFTYLIGHELGHAKIWLSDSGLFEFCWLIHLYLVERSKQGERILLHEFPEESHCDHFGVYLCEKLSLRSQLNREIIEMISEDSCKDRERLQWLLTISGSDDLDKLRADLVNSFRPQRPDLIDYWEKRKQNNRITCLTQKYERAHFEALFDFR